MVSDRSQLFGGRLANLHPATTTVQTLFTAQATTEITRIQICNVTNNNVDYSIFHDSSGGTYATASSLVYSKQVSGRGIEVIEAASQGSGITMAKGDYLGVSTSAADHLVFNVYGIVQKVR